MAASNAAGDILRHTDPDRYFATLFAPPAKRASLQALHAFDREVSSIRSKVQEPMAGEIRLQWWRDAVAVPQGRTGNPIADAVRATIAEEALPVSAFATYLEARIFDLYDDGMPDRSAFEAYAGETTGAILQLSALILDKEAARAAADACGHGACLAETVRLLAGLDRLDDVRAFVPGDLLAAAGTDRTGFSEDREARASVRNALVSLAREHREALAPSTRPLPRALLPALLPLAVPLAALARIETGRRPPGRLARQWAITRSAMRGSL